MAGFAKIAFTPSVKAVDYAARMRLEILAHASIVLPAQAPELFARLALPGYPARVERAFVLRVAAFDWNCPQHITPRLAADRPPR